MPAKRSTSAGGAAAPAIARATEMRSMIDSPSETCTCFGAEHVLADIERGDQPIPLTELANHPAVPKKRGQRVHVSACFRWASRGLRGHRLETARCGPICTTASAVSRFYARLSGVAVTAGTRTPGRRQKEVTRAERELQAAGL